jgi:excisionase family DNA binding protein
MSIEVASSRLLTVAEVAERLRVSERTVRRLIAAGIMPSVQLRGPRSAIRISERELGEWLFEDAGEALSSRSPAVPALRHAPEEESPAVEAWPHAGPEA